MKSKPRTIDEYLAGVNADQRIALEKICRLLKTNGMLFVGAAELPLVMENGFASANIPMAFACKSW